MDLPLGVTNGQDRKGGTYTSNAVASTPASFFEAASIFCFIKKMNEKLVYASI